MLDPELIEYLDRRFDAIDRRFEAIDQRFEGVDQRFDTFDQRFRELEILVEHLDSKIELVAEGVVANGEALREFRVDVDRQFAEVKAVNRLSYVELERRLTALEN